MKPVRILMLAVAATLLAACTEAPPAAPKVAPPILQGTLLRFSQGDPQLAQLGLAAAVPATPQVVDMPARLVWNEDRTQRIYPAFAGRVARIAADLGQPVRPGTVLARLASPDFGAAQADTVKAQVDAQFTAKALARQRELFEAGIIARKDLDQAEAEAARSQAEIQRALARTRLYGGAGTGVNQSLALITSVAGVVVERNLTPGQELRPDQTGPGVPPLFVVTDPTSLWVQIDARESEAGALRPGSSFELVVPALGGEKIVGRVAAVADAIDPNTRTIKVRGIVPNADRRLKAEMLATARIEHQLGEGVLIPAQSLMLRGGKHYVMVQAQPNTFESRDVEVGFQSPREALVTAGLKAGERVVSDNALLLARQYSLAQEAGGTKVATP